MASTFFLIVACTTFVVVAEADHTDIPYKYINGRPLQLDIYLPENDSIPPQHGSNFSDRSSLGTAYPLIIYIHGGGWKGGSKLPLPPFLPDAMNKAGAAVAAINYRLDTDTQWGDAPVVYPAQKEDVVDALAWLQSDNATKYLSVDTSRMMCLGGSAGGHLCSLLAAVANWGDRGTADGADLKPLKLAIPFFGPTDLLHMELDIDPSVGCWRDIDAPDSAESELLACTDKNGQPDGLGDLRNHSSKYPSAYQNAVDANPVSHIVGGAGATMSWFIAHGEADTTVPFKQSERLVDALKAAGESVEFVPVKDGNHGFKPHSAWSSTIDAASAWIAENL